MKQLKRHILNISYQEVLCNRAPNLRGRAALSARRATRGSAYAAMPPSPPEWAARGAPACHVWRNDMASQSTRPSRLLRPSRYCIFCSYDK
ncbi:hypothetical protein TIFTF001_037143 [Ficus carica]|uniref:Uncharacterized protein n=1 Tax=Ficus carica TaxID=3494 RepID=A0AA88E9A2_FICCA|nr:hypothetical protein TIFTF001_037143 [Ficus carica]